MSKDLKGAILFIQQYLKEMNIEVPEEYWGYPAKYGYPYGKYYKAKEEELTRIPYDQLDPRLWERKMVMHSEHASRLLKRMHNVLEPEDIPETQNELMSLRLAEALKEIKERKEFSSRYKKEEELSTDFPEQLRQARQEKLAKYDPTEPSREYKLCKEASKRIRAELMRAGKITPEEE